MHAYLSNASLLLMLLLEGVIASVNDHSSLTDCTDLVCGNGGQCGYEPGTNTTLSCICPPGYCGKYCQTQCQNGGTCINTQGASPRCECPGNYTGQRCEHLDACLSSPCPPDRRCVVDDFNAYRCECLVPGYYGGKCDRFNKCSESPCQNNGSCIFMGNNSYLCNCDPDGEISGYYGTDCEMYDPCLTSPCGHGGVCLEDPLGDGGTNITCLCDELHYGDYCQHVDQCFSSPCKNDGQCSQLESGDFMCDCPPGYFGKKCLISVCILFFCRNNGSCYVDGEGVPKCQCPDEYYGDSCESHNPCLEYDLCKHGGNCTDILGQRYTCDCPVGWTGFRCMFADKCSTNPCHENQTCVLYPFGIYTCECNSAGYYGTFCTDYNSCTDEPCLNGGKCLSLGNLRYECDCAPHGLPTGYYGKDCEHRKLCSQQVPGACSYHGECEYRDQEPGYECVQCDDGFYGVACERYDGCQSNPCHNDQPCISLYLFQKHYCNCSVQFRGEHCEIPVTCEGVPSSITISTQGLYFWPAIRIKNSVSLPCYVGDGYATRRCEAVISSKRDVLAIFWLPPDTSACQTVVITEELANNWTYYLISTTSKAEAMQEEEVTSSTDVVLAMYIYAYYDFKLANDIMLCISNLLEVNETILRHSSVESETNTKLLSVIDSYAQNAVVGWNASRTELVTNNIEIKVQDVPISTATSTGSVFQSSLPGSEGVSIRVPAEAFAVSDSSQATDDTTAGTIRVNYVVMANTKLFIGTSDNTESISGYAVSANVIGKTVNGLTEPVSITLPIEGVDKAAGEMKCAFWNEEDHKWDTAGMKLISTEGNDTSAVCESRHLTYFAVIMDPGLSDSISSGHVLALTIITKVGISITLLGLLLTFISYLLFKQLRGTRSGKILIHLCASLFGLNLVFLIDTIPSMTSSRAACLTCALLVHYFVLTSFAWMLMEAVNMYMALVQVFVRGSTGCFMNKCIFFSWGIPVAVVASAAISGLNSHYGRTMNMCLVLKRNPYVYYISYLGPCCVILAINFVVFAMVLHVVCSCRNKKKLQTTATAANVPREGVRKTQIGCALSVTFLLGLTWILGLFALREATLVFQYIFTILNTMQGFFIFLFRCALYPEAVRCWRLLLTQRTLNPRKTPYNTAFKNNTTQQSQKMNNNTSKLLAPPMTISHQPPELEPGMMIMSFVNAGYEPEKTGASLHQLTTANAKDGLNNYYMTDTSQSEMSNYDDVLTLRNVTLSYAKPRNDI